MATFRKRGPYQWQAQVRKKGHPLQTNTFKTQAAAESTTLLELLQRYLQEVTPLKKGAAPESARIRAFMNHPLALRIVANIRGLDIARKEWGIHTPNPVREIKLPPQNRSRNRRLQCGVNSDDSEETRLLAACSRSRNHFLLPVVVLALETAMRQGELVNMQWKNINLDLRTVHLPDTKNGAARTVPLPTIAIDVFHTLPPSNNSYVFDALTTEAIKRAFSRAAHRANFDDFRFHDLRHVATTRLFERGLNIMEVASITGHKDLRMLRRYTHLKAEDLAKKLA